MNDTGRSILEMLKDGQISLEAAERLLDAVIDKMVAQAVSDATATMAQTTAGTATPVAPSAQGSVDAPTGTEADQLPPVSGNAFVPWSDDNTLRIAAFVGHRIVKAQDGTVNFSVKLEGDAKDVVCYEIGRAHV